MVPTCVVWPSRKSLGNPEPPWVLLDQNMVTFLLHFSMGSLKTMVGPNTHPQTLEDESVALELYSHRNMSNHWSRFAWEAGKIVNDLGDKDRQMGKG